MGCRPSKHASRKVRATEAMGGGFGAHFGSGKFTRRVRPGDFVPQVKHTVSLATCQPSTEFSDFSTTTATYMSRGFKTSKITVRLSSDGSTLEIEKCEIEPEVVLQRSESAPTLPCVGSAVTQTASQCFQQTISADVTPIPLEFRSDQNESNKLFTLHSLELQDEPLSSEYVCKQTSYVQAPKATLDELDDFDDFYLPNVTLAIAEETSLLSPSNSFDNGSSDSSSSVCSGNEGAMPCPSGTIQITSSGGCPELLTKVPENQHDYLTCQINSVDAREPTGVFCSALVCNSSFCSCNILDGKTSSSSSGDGASGFAFATQIASKETTLAFCSYSPATDESWDRRIAGLGSLRETNRRNKETSRDGILGGFYPDDLSKQADTSTRPAPINQGPQPVLAPCIVKGEDAEGIKGKHNHIVGYDSSNATKNSCQSQSLNPDVIPKTCVSFYPQDTSEGQRNVIKISTNDYSLSVDPCVDEFHNSHSDVDILSRKRSVLEGAEKEVVSFIDSACTTDTSRIPRTNGTELPLTCKETISSAAGTSAETADRVSLGDTVEDYNVAYMHRGIINGKPGSLWTRSAVSRTKLQPLLTPIQRDSLVVPSKLLCHTEGKHTKIDGYFLHY